MGFLFLQRKHLRECDSRITSRVFLPSFLTVVHLAFKRAGAVLGTTVVDYIKRWTIRVFKFFGLGVDSTGEEIARVNGLVGGGHEFVGDGLRRRAEGEVRVCRVEEGLVLSLWTLYLRVDAQP